MFEIVVKKGKYNEINDTLITITTPFIILGGCDNYITHEVSSDPTLTEYDIYNLLLKFSPPASTSSLQAYL